MLDSFSKRYKRISPAVKASVAFTICSIFQKGIQFITMPIFTRLLTPEQYGQYTLYQVWLSIISIFATLNISAGGFENGMLKYKHQRPQFVSSLQTLANLITILVFLIYLFAKDFWNAVLGLPEIVVLAIFLELFFSPAFSLWSARQRYEYKYQALVLVTLLTSILNPVIGIIAVKHSLQKGIAMILSASLFTSCVGVVFYIVNFSYGKCFFNKLFWKFILSFDLPLIFHYLSQIVLSSSDRIMIDKLFGESKVALYSLANSIGMVMLILINSIGASFSPWALKKLQEKSYKEIGKIAEKLLLFMAAVTLIPVILAPEVICILGTTEYLDAVGAVAPIALANYFIYMYGFFSLIEFYFEKSNYVMVSSCFAAGLNIILNLIFMPYFGYLAAAYTTAGSYLFLVNTHYIAMKKICQKERIKEDIYNIHHFLLITAILVSVMFLFVLSYNITLLRYLLVLIFLIAILLKWETIKSIICGENYG